MSYKGAPDELLGMCPRSTPPTVAGLTDDRAGGEEVGGVAVDGQDTAVGVHGVDQVRGVFHQALIPGLGFLQLFLLAVDFFFQAGGKLLLIAEIEHDDGARQDHQADDDLEVELPGIEGMDHAFHFAGRGHHRHRPGGGRFVLLDQVLVFQL